MAEIIREDTPDAASADTGAEARPHQAGDGARYRGTRRGLCIYTCVCVRACVCMYVCTYVCMHACIYLPRGWRCYRAGARA